VSWFVILLILTTILRGIGAGIIFGVGILVYPLRNKVGITEYLKFIKVLFKGHGVKIYAFITVLGALLNIVLFVICLEEGTSGDSGVLIMLSLIATFFGFAGTGITFPTMKKLWMTNSEDIVLETALINRFEFWGWVSGISHIIAFCFLVVAICQF
jgi:hypothetical protein